MEILAWAVAAVVFLVLEAVTMGITSIWFAIGSICALIAAVMGAPLWLQGVWFGVISLVTLLLTRPLVRKYINGRTQATNADRVIGMEAVVQEPIDNLAQTGAVTVDGKVWTARSAGGESIPAFSIVRVQRIDGVKLIVSPAGERKN